MNELIDINIQTLMFQISDLTHVNQIVKYVLSSVACTSVVIAQTSKLDKSNDNSILLNIFEQVNPALLYNHVMFIVLYLTGFFLEKRPCTVCSLVSATAKDNM